MKIDKVLIHSGISYGIPEGTKVPEKPRSSCGGKPFCCEGTRCERLAYDEAIQALLSVSIQWEDQEAIAYYTPNEAFPTHAAAKKNPSVIDGIYPLEGVEVETVFQEKVYAGLRDGENDEFNWVEIEQHTAEMHIEHDTAQVRQVLRLIPQPNSEQKRSDFDMDDMPYGGPGAKEYNERLYEGTEVSEPTNPMDEYIAGLPDTRELVNSWIGVDEKKEPETYNDVSLKRWFMSHIRRAWRDSAKGETTLEEWLKGNEPLIDAQINEAINRGVSEEEPTQEQTWMEALKYLRQTLGGYSTTIHQARGLSEKYHIQKLKP